MIGLLDVLVERHAVIVLYIVLAGVQALIKPLILPFRKTNLELQEVLIQV